MSSHILFSSTSFLLAAAFWCAEADAQTLIHFDLPAQPLARSLKAIGTATKMDVGFNASQVAGFRAPPLKADLTVDGALMRVLVGTGLRPQHLNDHTIVIAATESSATHLRQNNSGSSNESAPTEPTKSAPETIPSTGRAPQISLAQANQETNRSATRLDRQDEQIYQRTTAQLEEVVVTGSRLSQPAGEGAQSVLTYTQEQIQKSGQADIGSFLNTLPDVSVASNPFGFRTTGGATTVQLHGLPIGTTLVLINGRRIGPSSAQAVGSVNAFDLNNIPIAAVERIEVLSTGSSAVYGSDAIAGVINIILKNQIDGFEANAKYGSASGTDEKDADLAWGHSWSRGTFSIVGSYLSQSELQGSERGITSSGDVFSRFGAASATAPYFCAPGNIYSVDNNTPLPGLGFATFAAVPKGSSGQPSRAEFLPTAGKLNTCSASGTPYLTFIPESERAELFARGTYQLNSLVELFTEEMYSHLRQFTALGQPYLFGLPGFQSYAVPATNPYNPFGTPVGVGLSLSGLGREELQLPSDFYRALVGARGTFGKSWDWEVAGWDVGDSSTLTVTNQLNPAVVESALNSTNPATALNPFVAQGIGSPALLQSLVHDVIVKSRQEQLSLNAVIRGTLFELPAGNLALAFGGEFDHTKLINDPVQFSASQPAQFQRNNSAIFTELRVPLLSRGSSTSGDELAVTLAGRYDHDQYFGSETTPQYGLEWRPIKPLLVRGTYSRAFKAPDLATLLAPTVTSPNAINDPRNGGAEFGITEHHGGNQNLSPETGVSHTEGFVFQSESGLQVSVTHWSIDESNSVQALSAQEIVDNEASFPGRVIRNSAGIITDINSSFINFGKIQVRGMDYQASWKGISSIGEFKPSVSVSQTYSYKAALTPGVPPTDRDSIANLDFNWAPRWKGILAVTYSRGPVVAHLSGRYVGKYRDYEPLLDGDYQTLGNFWLWDANVHLDLTRRAYVEIGGVNLFNTLPQFSNNGGTGFDGTQADLRGRYLYGKVGTRF
jgi:iron complex outermembrane receptor protein